jgi:hypothetical protein
MEQPTRDEKISQRLDRWLNMNRLYLTLVIIANVAAFVVLFIFYVVTVGWSNALQNTIQELVNFLVIQIVLVVFGYFYLAYFKIPAEVDKETEDRETKIQSLNSRGERAAAVEPPTIAKRFSLNLEKIKEERIKAGWEITGIGLNFLDRVKATPPFLGLHHDKPIISASDERTLTEFFLASIYIEKYREVIKGGRNYIVRDEENDRKAIAKAVYGHEKYEVYVPALHSYISGMVLTLPYINLDRPDHPDEIERIVTISKDTENIISLLEPHNLVRREAIPLLRIIYDAAQKTRNERETIIRAEKHVYPTYAKYGAQEVGVTLYNDGKQNLTDVYIKLVRIANKGFDDETGWVESIPIDIKVDNHLFDSQENTIRSEDKTTFILAKVQDNEVVLLLKKRPHKLKRRHTHVNPQNFLSHEQWEIEFDVHGKVAETHLKERFFTVIDSTKIKSFADSTLEDSLTLDIKGEIIHLQRNEPDQDKDSP